MVMSASTHTLRKPQPGKRISTGSLAYISTRNRLKAFSLIHDEFRKSGITQSELARRLGKGPDRVCKLLGAPGNWTLDTISELLFAISGKTLTLGADDPQGLSGSTESFAARRKQTEEV